MGASVDERIYPGMGHTISADELAAVQALLTTPGHVPADRHTVLPTCNCIHVAPCDFGR